LLRGYFFAVDHTMISRVIDLVAPKYNLNTSSPFSYLTVEEIEDCKVRIKKLDIYQEKYLKRVYICSDFSTPVIHNLIMRLKYCMEWSICGDFSQLIHDKLYAPVISPLAAHRTLIVHIPADQNRLLQRSFHAPKIIASQLSKKWSIQTMQLVSKKRSTQPQFHLSRIKRLKNLEDGFEIVNPLTLNLSRFDTIIIVDDVTTTGSTLYECAKVISTQYPFLSIIGIAVAGN
jgi:ComF family protein